MPKKHSTKRALLASVLSLLLCVSMLIGTTFAWFTDSVTSNGNKIQSGTLNIDMSVKENGTYKSVKTNSDAIFDYTLWEPGYTVWKNIKVSTTGNLALKYEMNIVLNGERSILADVIDVYYAASEIDKPADRSLTGLTRLGTISEVLNGATGALISDTLIPGTNTEDYATIVLKMQESANNDYQGKTIGEFDINLVATQYTYEEDSFDEKYDEDALYSVAEGLYVDNTTGNYVAYTTEGLSSVAAMASDDSSISSVTYVTEDGEVEVPVVSDFSAFDSAIDNNKEIVVLTNGGYQMPDGSDTSLVGKELTVVGTKDAEIDVSNVDERDQFVTGATLKFEGVTLNFGTELYMGFANCVELVYKDCIINGVQHLYGNSILFDGCTLNVTGDNYMVRTWGGKNVTFNDCTFNCDGKALLVYNQSCNLTVNDCVFNDNGDGTIGGKAAIEACNGDNGANCVTHNIVINNTTVNGFDINTSGINTNTTLWANKNSLDDDHLNVTVNGVVVY